jgi:erythronate-4-phosphate dehydrogenase
VRQYVGAALLTLAERRGFRLDGLTIGVVGVGNVGTKVAQLGAALGMTVLLNDPPRARREGPAAFVSLDEIVRRSDIVSFHVPLQADGDDATFHLVDAALLAAFRPGQVILNTSRGEVVDGSALKRALRGHRLAAAVLDVWEYEPAIDRDLMALVDIATPHIAGYSADGKANGTAMSVQALSRFFGLGLDDWYPSQLPAPANPVLEIDADGLTPQQVIARVVRTTYDIEADDARLRADPESFERQRTEHPFRREFHSYSVVRRGLPGATGRALAAMGFRTAELSPDTSSR